MGTASSTRAGRRAGSQKRDVLTAKRSESDAKPRSDDAVASDKAPKPGAVHVSVAWSDLGAVDCDVVLVGHYMGVAPQRAELKVDQLVSDADHRPEGKLVLTELSRRGAIRGELGEILFFPHGGQGKLCAVAGMGRPGTFRTPQLRRLARTVTQVVGLLPHHKSLACVVIGSGEGNIPMREAVEAFLSGMLDSLGSDPALRLDRVTFVERELDRAMDIQQTLRLVAADMSHRADARRTSAFNLDEDLREGTGGVIAAEFGCSMILASLGMNAGSEPDVNILDTLLARLPESVRQPVREQLLLQQEAPPQGQKDPLREQAMRFRLRQTDQKPSGRTEPVRVTFSRSGDDVRETAITNTTTVTERIMPRRAKHVEHASERLYQPDWTDEFRQLARRLRGLVVHRDIQDVLDRDDPMVIEVDRAMAAVPWEMLPVGADGEPMCIARPMARQLRTYYSPRPFDIPRRGTRRALVIADPGDEDHSLEEARQEGRMVHDILKGRGVDCDLLIGPPEPMTGKGTVPGYEPADYYDVVERLQYGEYDIVHFCGHASFDVSMPDRTGWVFKDGILSSADLEGMESPPRLVFANACLSAQVVGSTAGTKRQQERMLVVAGLADQFFKQGVRDYIGTSWEVLSDPAVKFAEVFYTSLLRVDKPAATIGEALRVARAALYKQMADGEAVWATYQHYGDPTSTL